ncbi:Thioredoxin reductase [Dissulfuribacter thermophilus]|uniref:Thioredoxin reductase n=1 Tax=Dissulfuribacter thermophilus TaxID=1156395 RepID=A0A1B9F3M9_9BACT|nr:NAD(P)-binding domain-containing protein [Dissulfuribacter thermophilus]OCC14371.1 Thioredoxin reductase [Dissulfuribacter thermophilus]
MEQANLVIIGAGPAGIATAVEAKEVGIENVILLEKKGHICDTVVSLYHEGKRVDPVYRKVKVEPLGKLSFETECREEFLERMKKVVEDHKLDIRYWNEAQKIKILEDSFIVQTGGELEVKAPIVVVAIGVFGKPVKPSYPIPKEIKNKVFFALPKEPLKGKKILVVGGGDTAAETACFLSNDNSVDLSYRREKFFRINPTNMCSLEGCCDAGKINLLMGTDIEGLEGKGDRILVHFKDGKGQEYDAVFYCLGGMTPRTFLEGVGVEFEGNKPKIDEYGETNIPRLFLVGDLALLKGSIMAAFNTGKKTIDGIVKKYKDVVGLTT